MTCPSLFPDNDILFQDKSGNLVVRNVVSGSSRTILNVTNAVSVRRWVYPTVPRSESESFLFPSLLSGIGVQLRLHDIGGSQLPAAGDQLSQGTETDSANRDLSAALQSERLRVPKDVRQRTTHRLIIPFLFLSHVSAVSSHLPRHLHDRQPGNFVSTRCGISPPPPPRCTGMVRRNARKLRTQPPAYLMYGHEIRICILIPAN